MEKMGVFISMYLVLGLAAVVGGILIKNRPEKSSVHTNKKAA